MDVVKLFFIIIVLFGRKTLFVGLVMGSRIDVFKLIDGKKLDILRIHDELWP
jgi:hypothetical protein